MKYLRFYFIFYVKISTLLEKGHLTLSQQPPSKNWGPVNFENLVVGSTLPPQPPNSLSPTQKGGAHYENATFFSTKDVTNNLKIQILNVSIVSFLIRKAKHCKMP